MPRAEESLDGTDTEGGPRHRRTYRACLACRSAKLRCDLGSVDAPSAPPCRRCRRTGRPCEFAEPYQRQSGSSRPRKSQVVAPYEEARPVGIAPRLDIPMRSPVTIAPKVALSTPESPRRGELPPRLDFVYDRNLETPADALNLLCDVAHDNRASELQATPLLNGDDVGGDAWNCWAPVRDGMLTSHEAATLVHFYARNINPSHPIIPVQLFQVENLPLLLQEPVLLGAIVCVAARYTDLGQSFDPREPSRSRMVQTHLVEWLMQRIAFITMGSSNCRTIGTVEAMLILSEWPPSVMFMEDKVGASSRRDRKSSVSACKQQNDIAWTLVGLAVRIAQELGLHDESTYASQSWLSWQTLRRLNTWIQCMSADRHVSGRLGRASLIPKMSTNWWEMFFFMSFESSDQFFPMPRSQRMWRLSRVMSEHAHIIGICNDLLYPSPAVTADLIKTGRYQSILARLKPELEQLWAWLVGDLPRQRGRNGEPVDETQPDGIDPDLQELMWRIDHDYVRLYANAIAMRATVTRILRHRSAREAETRQRTGLTAGGDRLRLMEGTMLCAVEGVQVHEAVDAAIALLRHGIECHRRGVLRFCPGRTFQRIMFASVFLMKAMSVGAVAEKEPAILELQHNIIACFRDAAVDGEHIGAEVAGLLARVFPAFPAVPSQFHIEGVDIVGDLYGASSVGTDHSRDPTANYVPGVAEPSGVIEQAQVDLFANWGFDPVIILSEMDDFIQAIDGNQVEIRQ